MKIPSSCKTKRLQKQRSRNCAWLFSSNLVFCMSWRSFQEASGSSMPCGWQHSDDPGSIGAFQARLPRCGGWQERIRKCPQGPKDQLNFVKPSPIPELCTFPAFPVKFRRHCNLRLLAAHVPYGSRARAEQLEPVELGTWGTFQASLCSGPSYSFL